MRIANNSFIGSQGLAGFFNSPLSNQDNLISIMNREDAKKQKETFVPMLNPAATSGNINSAKGIYDPKTGAWTSSGNLSVALQNLQDRKLLIKPLILLWPEQGLNFPQKRR
ncbi:MAG: hypothetical protein ACM3YE_05715 [Bacteroidota bacterium]